MAESQEPYNVVLEIGEENGVKTVSNNVVIGQNDIDVYYGCKEPVNSQGDMGFNPTPGFPDIYKEGYKGNHVGAYFGVGDLSSGCSQTQIQPNLSGIAYEPTSSSKLIMFNLATTPGLNPPGFYRLEPWTWGNGLYRPYNGVQQARQNQWNVQGRCLYIKRTLGVNVTMCFDIVDAYGNDMLIVKGNGRDHLDDYALIDNTWHVGNQNFNHENYEWYVSPYVHSGKWDSSGNNLKWSSESQSKTMSYKGQMFGSSQQNLEINECFVNEGYLGLRSSDFREAIDGGSYDDNQPGINQAHDCWEIKITVGSINNAKIQLFEGTPENPAITSGLTNGFEITTAGTYTVCLAALPHSAVWKGKNNPGGFTLTDAGMERVAGSPAELADIMDGQITLLNITPLDNGTSASAIIEKIELNKKDPDIKIESEDIFGSTVNYDVPDYKWSHLEVTESEGVPLSLNFSVGDIGDISKRTAGYSKTFMLPASAHNNAIITPMLAVNSQKSTIGWQRGRVKANGVHIFEGLLRIEEGNTANGGFYKCHIVEDTIDWTEDLGESKLCDVFMLGDDGANGWTSPTKAKGSFEVQDSWLHSKPFDTFSPGGHHVPAQPWFWGLAQYGEWYFKSLGVAGKEFKHNAQDFHPVVYTKVLVDRIFESIGYTVQSNFFNSTTAHLLCHPFGSGEDYLVTNNIFGTNGDYYGKAKTSGSYQASDLLGTSNFKPGGYIPASGHDRTWYPSIHVQSDVSNSFTGNGGTNKAFGSSNHGYVIPFDGDWKFALAGVIDVSFHYYGDGGSVDVEFLKNGVVVGYIWPGQLPGVTDHGQHAFSGSVTLNNCNAGDVLSFRIKAETYMWCCKYWVRAEDLEALVYPLATGAVPSISMNNSKILTCDTKQIDVLKGLTDMFNLQWKADAINKTIHIEPYNDFFGSGATLDWTDKIDLSRWNDKFIVEELAKEIVFRYERDSQDNLIEVVDRWRESNGKGEYQTHIEIQNERFRKKTVELGTGKFKVSVSTNAYGTQPTPNQHANGDYGWGDLAWTNPQTNKANPLMPIYWMSEGGSINGIARPERVQFPKMKLRIVNNYSLLNGHNNEQSYNSSNRSVHKCSNYKWEDDSGNTTTLDEYPYMDWKNGWLQGIDTDPYCLSWNNFDDTRGKESLGLFEKYWRVAYEKMNGGSVLRTAFINLTPIDIATFDFRDLIHIRIDNVSTYWTINKIVDYQPNKSVLTKVELLEYKQAVDFAREYSGEAKKRKVDLTKEVTSEPKQSLKRDGGFELQNDTNNSAQGKGVALGTGVVASDNQTVIGRYNNPNSTDIFQVGIGTSDDDRRTAFSIDKDGCVKVGGGEIYVEEADGTIHDLIVKKPSYKIAETIINENGDVSIRAIDFSDTDIEKLYSTRETEEEARTVAKVLKDRGNQY